MKFFIDASRYNNTDKKTGVENYSYHLINALVENHGDEIVLISPRKIPLKVEQRIIPFPRLWTQLRLSAESILNKKFKNLFIPSHFMPIFHPKNTVITIHDVAFRHFPESYRPRSRWYLDWGTRFAVKNAQKIITPSQATKTDLVKLYGANQEKITVIPHGHTSLNKGHKKGKGGKSFLFIGRIERKKNLITLIQAFKKIHQKHPEWQLILAGKDGVGAPAIKKAAKGNTGIQFLGYISENKKIELLQNAAAFVFPSHYEGFGLPLLEAMEFELPIIASNISASREVMGDQALFFEAKDINELANHLQAVISSPKRVNYQHRLNKYTWEEVAKKTWETLKN